MAWTYYVIGGGSIGRRHYGNLQSMGKSVELLPWRTFDTAQFGERLKGCAGKAAAIIATATDIRAELVEICAAQHVPVYIEKPLAFCRKEFDQIYAIAPALQRRSIVGFMLRYHPLTEFLRAQASADFFRLRVEIGYDVRQWRSNWSFANSYAAQTRGGGALLDLCHEIDLIGLLCPALRLHSVQSIGHAAFPGVDLVSTLAFSAPRGAIATVSMDYLSPVLQRSGRLTSCKCSISFDFVNGTALVQAQEGLQNYTFEHERNAMFLRIMQDFITLVEGAGAELHPCVPRMDLVKQSCDRIVRAWHSREFIGTKEVELI